MLSRIPQSSCIGPLALAVQTPDHAWGAEVHRITDLVAYELLTPQERAAIRYLLGTYSLTDATVWMDQNRPALGNRFHGSGGWHFDGVDVCGQSVAADVCPNGNYASAKIAE